MAYRDKQWSIKIYHTLAKPLIYQHIWEDAEFVLLEDNDAYNIFDLSGIDVAIKHSDNLVFMGQRFRRSKASLKRGFDDFTLRDERPYTGYKAEAHKLIKAYREGQNIPKYYAYGHVNADETGFDKFRVLNTVEFLKKWSNNELPYDDSKDNHDGSSSFLAWKFKKIPRDCIFRELRTPTTLEHKQGRLGC